MAQNYQNDTKTDQNWGKNDRMSHFKIIARNKNIIGTHFVNSVMCVDKTIQLNTQSIWNAPHNNCSLLAIELLSIDEKTMRYEN